MNKTTNQPLISVIVPVYNVEKYLDRCVESLLRQTYPNLEIILVDDGSKDSSGQICDRYAKQYKHISVIHQQNMGLSGARNSGLDICQGEYVAFVDSDDYVEDDMYSHMLEKIQDAKADICVCRWQGQELDGTKTAIKDKIDSSVYGVHYSREFSHFLYGGGI